MARFFGRLRAVAGLHLSQDRSDYDKELGKRLHEPLATFV
jgi:hypothetical protein